MFTFGLWYQEVSWEVVIIHTTHMHTLYIQQTLGCQGRVAKKTEPSRMNLKLIKYYSQSIIRTRVCRSTNDVPKLNINSNTALLLTLYKE